MRRCFFFVLFFLLKIEHIESISSTFSGVAVWIIDTVNTSVNHFQSKQISEMQTKQRCLKATQSQLFHKR